MSEVATAVADPSSLEELTQRWADALGDERAGYWRAADVAAYVLRAAPTRAARRRLVGHLAAIGHCSRGYVRALAGMSAAYGTEYRYPDVSQALLRACIAAARRLGRKPHEVLEDALARNLHAAGVHELGRAPAATVGCEDRCEGCGATVRVRLAAAHRPLRGLVLACPVCVALARQEDREVDEVPATLVIG